MTKSIRADICVIGAGSAGLSVAAGAAQMGAKVVLIEKSVRDGAMGGDCLHTGCVPSKALLAAGKQAKAMGDGAPFGVKPQAAEVDFAAAMDHVQSVIRTIAPIDSVERFRNLGVEVIEATARFVGPREVEAGGVRVRAKWIVVATGSTPRVPPIPGLSSVPFLTNETVFQNRTRPDHLIVVGGGPIGLEMAQAHRRLGAKVTVLEAFRAMPKDDPDLASVVLDALREEGVVLREGIKIGAIAPGPQGVRVSLEENGTEETLEGSHLLVATGRAPTVVGLDLEKAGIAYSAKGIEVDARLRTTNKQVFAIGDVAGGLQFTHVAGYHAGIVVRNALLRLPTKSDTSLSPWVTYTDPELAHVGLTEAQARERHGGKVRVLTWDFAENDRAQAERLTRGFVKVVAGKGGRILGVSIVGAQAGELLYPWLIAMNAKRKLTAFTGTIAPYPTLGEASKRAAGAYYTDFLFGPTMRFAVRSLLRLPF